MKVGIHIKGPKDFSKGIEVDIPDLYPLKTIEFTGEKKEEKLRVIVQKNADRGIDCEIKFIEHRNMQWERTIIFRFLNILPLKPRRVVKRRGQNFLTGKFVPWTCYLKYARK